MGECVPEPQYIKWRRYCKKAKLDLETFKKQTIELLQDLEDSEPCELDHHGNCQAHGWVDTKEFPPWRECPQKRLKECLKTLKRRKHEHDNNRVYKHRNENI